MVDSTTAVEIVTRGPSLLGIGIVILFMVWIYCKLKDLIYGDE